MAINNHSQTLPDRIKQHSSSVHPDFTQTQQGLPRASSPPSREDQSKTNSIEHLEKPPLSITHATAMNQYPSLDSPLSTSHSAARGSTKPSPSLLSALALPKDFLSSRESRFKSHLPFAFVVLLSSESQNLFFTDAINNNGEYRTDVPDEAIVAYCHKYSDEIIPTITVGELRQNSFHCLNFLFASLGSDQSEVEPFEAQECNSTLVSLFAMFRRGIYVKREDQVAQDFLRGMSSESFSHALGPALVYSIYSEKNELVRALIEAGAHFSSVDSEGENAITGACLSEKEEILKTILTSAKTSSDIEKIKQTKKSLKNNLAPAITQILTDFLSVQSSTT